MMTCKDSRSRQALRMKKTTRTFAVVALVLGLSAVAAVLTASATDVEAATGDVAASVASRHVIPRRE